MRRCRKRTRKGERKVDPPRRQPVQRVFGRLALTVGPRIHLLRYRERFRPTRGPTPTNCRALPDRENPSSRTGRPQLAATTSLKRDLWGTRGHEGKKKVRCGKRFEVEKGGGRRTVHPSVPVVPRAAWSGEWREMSL